jgi:hypothetical protein
VPERRLVVSLVALALTLAGAVGYLSLHADDVQPPLLLLIAGAGLVGGAARRRWWLGTLVGLGVPCAVAWARATGYALPDAVSPLSALLSPGLALAASGLGAALQRHVRGD